MLLNIVRSATVQYIAVAIISSLLILGAEKFEEGNRVKDIYYHQYPSDSMQQTIDSSFLQKYPLQSIFYIHVQPPMIDIIRGIVVQFWNHKSGRLSKFLDERLYFVWAMFFGCTVGLVFLWVRKATSSTMFALAVASCWLLNPSAIYLSTFLDGTLLSSLLITWLLYEVWLVWKGEAAHIRLTIATILLFFTRTIFQWYFIPILIVALLLLRLDRRRLTTVGLFLVLVVGAYGSKQYFLYGTLSTTTMASEHLSGMLWIEEANPSGGLVWRDGHGTEEYKAMINRLSSIEPNKYPDSAKKYSNKYNSEDQWKLNIAHSEIVKKRCAHDLMFCLRGPFKSLRQNFSEYWFVQSWGDSVLISALPVGYKKFWYRINVRYLWFLVLAGGWVLFKMQVKKQKQLLRLCGLVLIPCYIVSVCMLANRYDWYEGGRIKYLLEPTYFVFISVQAYWFMKFVGPGLFKLAAKRLKAKSS